MLPQTPSDTELLLELVGEAYAFRDLTSFRSGVLELVDRMVPCDMAGYNEIGPDQAFVVMRIEPAANPVYERLLPVFTELAHENPLLSRYRQTGDGRPYRISDLISQETFHRLALYQQFYRPLAVEYQAAFCLPSSAPLVVGIALCRERDDFSERDLQLLSLARPHLIQAYRNAELWGARTAMLAALESGLNTLGRQIVVLDPVGRVEFATDGARSMLGDKQMMRLQHELQAWSSMRRDPRPTAEPLVVAGRHGPILVRVLPGLREDRRQVLLIEGGVGTLTVEALRGLGLTGRQAQTLRLLALGYSTSQVSTEMKVARRTVDKHLQNIYSMLGVSTLEQATATAWAAVGIEYGSELQTADR